MIEEQTPTQQMMQRSSDLASIITGIDEVIIILDAKRVTLEEKMLRKYLHEVAMSAANIISNLHQLTGGGATCEPDVLKQIKDTVDQTRSVLDELLKAARYNLNYLEQYFEHGFYARLINEEHLIEKLQSLENRLGAEY